MNTRTSLCSPLASTFQYSPKLKIEHCLYDELWPSTTRRFNEKNLDMIVYCAQLELCCKRELLQHANKKVENGNTTVAFESKAMIYVNRMQTCYDELPQPKLALCQYLVQKGIAKLYPRAYLYLSNPESFNLELRNTNTDYYNHQLSVIHQVIQLSKQINADVTTSTNHKYIAHQVAVLFQCIKLLKEVPQLSAIKCSIEKNFSSFKNSLDAQSEGAVKLPEGYSQWLLQITEEIVSDLQQYPEEATMAMKEPAQIVSALL